MTDNGKNDPLPVKSKERTEYDVRAVIDLLADEVGAEVEPETVVKNFRDCRGMEGETTNDGRFYLSYLSQASLPREQYNTALRTLRKKLEATGYKVSDYREGDWRHIMLIARGGDDNLFVRVGAARPPYDRLVLSVKTPCFLPPGVDQEQVSAPHPSPRHDADPVAAAPQPPAPARQPDSGEHPTLVRHFG